MPSRSPCGTTIAGTLLLGFALANIVACVPMIRLVVTNQMTDSISVEYAAESATIGRAETETLVVPALDLPLFVRSGEDCTAFQGALGSLPGKYYRPGLRHSVEISVIGSREIRIEPIDEDLDPIVVNAIECEEAAGQPDR